MPRNIKNFRRKGKEKNGHKRGEMKPEFHSLYTHGFIRAAVCIPHLKVADPAYNVARTIGLARKASAMKAALALFPELGLSAYSNEDLFHQDALLAAVRDAIRHFLMESRQLTPVLVVGAPLRCEGRLFNCALVIYRGRLLGVVPKTYIPNYREFYEKRQFASARDAVATEISLLGRTVPFGNDLIFAASTLPDFILHAEICEDVWTPIPPSTYAAMAGATVLLNLSASNIIIGKADYRRKLCAVRSGSCIAAYLYSAAGQGESTTDLAWDGHALIFENDECLAESDRFAAEEQIISADIDLQRIVQERMRMTSFHDAAGDHRERVGRLRRVDFEFEVPAGPVPLARQIERFPFVPADAALLDERCYEPTTFRCTAWPSGWPVREFANWSSASRVAWIPPRRSSWRPRPWIAWGCRAPRFSALPCRGSPPATGPTKTPSAHAGPWGHRRRDRHSPHQPADAQEYRPSVYRRTAAV